LYIFVVFCKNMAAIQIACFFVLGKGGDHNDGLVKSMRIVRR
jgi:hypothetical protein